MGILLVRHGDAVQGGGDVDDAARWLSRTGRERTLAAAHALRAKGLKFDRFVASPRVRAVQTAELFARVLGFEGTVESVPALSFTVPAERAVEALKEYKGNVAAFGHMPTIAEIVERLTGAQQATPLATSEAVFIERGRLLWRLAAEDET
jgi:phosphohistidine phosphatase